VYFPAYSVVFILTILLCGNGIGNFVIKKL